jgi:hypothetical protein
MKRLFSLILSATVIVMVIVSCKDDFNEQDFLKLQSELKLKQDSARRARNKAAGDSASKEVVQSYINAQNAAGALMAVTIIVREDNTPVQGVTVSISSGTSKTDGRTQAIVTGNTDAMGTVVFESTVIANSTVTLSKAGYVTASALVDFGSPEDPIPVTVPSPETGGTKTLFISPQKRYENISLPVFSESATEGNTAVIKGTFTIENDMTNDPSVADVLPTGLVISADIASALIANNVISSACNCVGDYRFSGAAGSLGVAPIQANGDFSMRVPATAAGLQIDLIYPRIAGTSRMAIRRINGQDVAPQFMNVPTIWEPGNSTPIAAVTNAIPQIPGAMAVFSAATPPPPGRGFGATFAPIARSLGQGTISNNGHTTINSNTYNFALRGRGYTSSPAVSITLGGGTGATATASLRGYITTAQVTNGGTDYAANTEYDIVFTYTDQNGSAVEINRLNVTSTPAGVIPVAALSLPASFGFPGGAMFATGQGIQGFGVRVSDNNLFNTAASTTPAVVAFTTETEVDQVVITDGGTGYLSAPTIGFSGGGASTQASISVVAYRSQYTVTLSTTPATTPYKLLPAQFVFTYPSNAVDGLSIESPAMVDRMSSNLSTVAQDVTLLSQVVTDGTNITALNPQHTFRTDKFWTAQPTLTVVDQTVDRAVANVTISAAGEVTSIVNPTGDVTSINDLYPNALLTVVGNGYDALSVAIMPTIASGAPGSGAAFSLSLSQDVASKEVTWTGASTQISAGSGYLQNLNRATTNVPYTPEASPVVVTGQTYTININAGHGIRAANVSNN